MIGFECVLSLDEEICPRFIMNFYKTLRLNRYLEDNRLFMTFDINGHEFNISLDQFAKLTSLPNQGTCLYSDLWSLDQLENTLEQVPPYNSSLPPLEDIRTIIHQRVTFENQTKHGLVQKLPNQIETNELLDHLKPCELVIRENAYVDIGNRDHVQGSIALMLYSLEVGIPYNLAYFVVRRMDYFRNRVDKVVPYGLILTCFFKNLKERMANYPFDDRYILVPRRMSSFKVKHPKRPPPNKPRNVGKSTRAQLPSSSSSESAPSDNGELPSTKLSPRSYHRALLISENMSDEQRETRGMFKNMAWALHRMGRMLTKGCR
ncbi:hypothetical protein Tco_0984339 [Tanacetum coccineum]